MKRQCEFLELNPSSIYYTSKEISAEKKEFEELIKARLDLWHTQQCYLEARRLKAKLEKEDNLIVGRKLIRRYIRNKTIRFSNQVWAIDITYIKMGKSHMYLTTIIDWYSRFITRWQLSDTLDTAHVLEAMENTIVTHGTPSIINSDQGSQFTSKIYANLLEEVGYYRAWTAGQDGWIMLLLRCGFVV